jgi:hypothetical protein
LPYKALGVRDHWLVEQQQAGPLAKREGQRHLSPHTSGEGCDGPVERDVQAAQSVAREGLIPDPVQVGTKGQMVGRVPAGVEGYLLSQVPDLGQKSAVVGRGPSEHQCPSRGGPAHPGEQAHQGGLARPVGADQPRNPADRKLDRAIPQGPGEAKLLAQADRLDHQFIHAIASDPLA